MQGQQDGNTHHSVRRAYGAPQLIEFGRVRDLTAGGSQGLPEGQSNSPQKVRS